jgi:hypothetical protein
LATLNYDTYPIRAAKESTVENANENSENSPVEEVHTIIMSAEQQAKVRAFWTDQNHRLLAMRSKDREFHGLQREFLYSQAEMLQNYEKSKDIQHPRDVGTTREAILGRFLEKSGYIPKRYSVSNTSVRVASTEGFISREIDILLFDRDTSILLMQREDAYQVYPVESAYGAIEVKSKLTKPELRKAFENIASFKRLRKVGIQHTRNERGFGIVFAYDSDLDWSRLVEEVKNLAAETTRTVLPNLVLILNKGYFVFGDGHSGSLRNIEIESIQELCTIGNSDPQHCLFSMYTSLMTLLRDSEAPPVPIELYFNLPLTAGKYSYEYAYGIASELGTCPSHGSYLRKFSEEGLEKVLSYCRGEQPLMYSEALAEAYGNAWVAPSDPWRRLVWIYNPERRALSDILVYGSVLAIDEILVDGTSVLVPR